MKTFKIKNFVLIALIALCFFCISLYSSNPQQEAMKGYALFTTSNIEKDINGANTPSYTPEEAGSIPFSLYTSKCTESSGTYIITDYFPNAFTYSTQGEGETAIHHYSINDDSIPYIMLSSNEEHTASYNTTVFFKFNDKDFKSAQDIDKTTISTEAGYLLIEATINGTQIVVPTVDTSNASTDDVGIVFAVNLKDITDVANGNIEGSQCPETLDGNKLGSYNNNGTTENDPSFRTGLYSFKISYSYQDIYGSQVSNKCVFTFKFYVLDYNSYVEDVKPLSFTNTDTYVYEKEIEGTVTEVDSNYEIYNYNYLEEPYVEFDATKFALNYVYTTGYTNYAMQYDSFNYNPGCSPSIVKDSNFPIDTQTGNVVVKLKDSDLVYSVPTYKRNVGKDLNNDNIIEPNEYVVLPYFARFDLADFENFIVTNKINSTNQGEYTFNLDFLIQNDITYTVFDNAMFSDMPSTVNNQKLVLFGYKLKYYDQDPTSPTYKQNVELKNDVTHTNFISYNNMTMQNGMKQKGFLVDIPKYIAITDQAPLRFDYYGNLDGSQMYTSPFGTFDYKTIYENGLTQEQYILEMFESFDSIEDLSGNTDNALDKKLGLTYIQGSSISNDGIRIMKLIYNVNITIEEKPAVINGCQYVVFEINNSIQNLYVQAVDFKETSKQSIRKTYDFKEFTNKDVRINIEEKPNTFFAPLQITYNYYPSFNVTDSYTSGTLYYKTVKGLSNGVEVTNNYSYKINDKTYNYLVTNNSNNFTFENTKSGAYIVTIKSIVTNIPSVYDFTIDNENFTGISVKKASLNNEEYVLDDEINATVFKGTSIKIGDRNLLTSDIYVTDSAFTLGWNNKRSNAESNVYFYFMSSSDDSNLDNSMFKTDAATPEYWVTNGISIATPGGADTDYLNYKDYPNYATKTLDDNSYFNLDGIYFFYVYDEAGNFFTITVIIDSSINSILQGKWEGKEEESLWINTYEPDKNPANYVNEKTTIYFGNHKALKLPDLSATHPVSFEDTSFVRAYEYADVLDPVQQKILYTGSLVEKPKITFDLFRDVLTQYTNYVKKTSTAPLIGTADTGYYFTLENTKVTYEREYVKRDADGNFIVDETGADIISFDNGDITEIYKAVIYDEGDPSKYGFNDEGQYYFIVTNKNKKQALKDICMNFDMVQGTFWAYSLPTVNNPTPPERLIRKNNGTNLDVLKFVFNILDDETAQYYKVESLTFKYYAFVLDETSLDSSAAYYPFANKITKQGQLDISKTNADGTQTIVDAINVVDASNKTVPGKYVLTRTYVGGTHDKNKDTGEYYYVGTGGKYYQVKDEHGNPAIDDQGNYVYEDLFKKDVLVRNYTVYIDRNGIITTEYMIRNDSRTDVREVGDNISITLSQGYEDSWNFKEFFLTSSATLSLDTNKVPVKINIPLSKYFVYFNPSSSLYAKQTFAELEIIIEHNANSYTAIKYYKVDGYDLNTGLCTCSALKSTSNPLGLLIFNAEGTYTIHINDKTGYTDTSSLDIGSRNINPTTYTYTFKITHLPPEAQAKTSVYDYDERKHFEKVLINEYSMYDFATNIKQKDATDNTIAYNEFIVNWADPVTPYQAKVKQANLTVSFEGQTNKYKIDLLKYNLLDIASSTQEIDVSNIEHIEYFKIKFYNDVDVAKIYDHKEYYRFEYIISLNIEKEFVYKLELSYVSESQDNQDYLDENGKSFATSIYTLIIDRTKPNTNIDKLLKEEVYLISSNYYSNDTINNFKEENFEASLLESSPSAFTYAFGVSDNYQLIYNENETLPYFFVRSYQKFDNDEEGYTSITPDMNLSVYDRDKAYSDYENNDIPAHYPRFKEYNTTDSIISIDEYLTWHKVYYKPNTPLKNLIASAISPNSTTKPNGFFEIIERDLAGNYRNFTVYYNEKEKLFLNLQIDGMTQKDNMHFLVSTGDDANQDNISANYYFEMSEIYSTLGWGTLYVTNSTTNIPLGEFQLTPFDTSDYNKITERLNKLNEFMKTEINSKFTFALSKYNATYTQPALTRHINLNVEGSGELEAPIIEEVKNPSDGKISYNLILPAYDSKRVLYLEDFTLQMLKTNTWQTLPNYTFVGKENVKAKVENLEKGVYKAIYKDNFNEFNYSFILYVGEYYIKDFNKEYKFEFNNYYQSTNMFLPSGNNTIYYTGGDIEVTYESNIYKVYLTTNFGEEVLISGNPAFESISTSLPNCKTFKLSKSNIYNDILAQQPVGGLDIFTIKYVDITDNSIVQKVVNFGIYNVLPEIYLTNFYGGEVVSTLQESDTQVANSIVNVSWGDLLDNDFYYDVDNAVKSVIATLYTKNEKGEYVNGIRISKGQLVTEEGFYKLELKNELLGNYREIYFAISFSDIPLYSITSGNKKLSASTFEKLDFTVEENRAYETVTSDSNLIINVLYNAINKIDYTLLPTSDRLELIKQLGFGEGVFNPANVGICNLTQIKHYYYNDTVNVTYNSNIELNIVEFVFKNNILQKAYIGDKTLTSGISQENPTPANVGSDYWTTIYLLYNLNGPIKVEFFALTKVPKTSQLLNNSIYYINEKTNSTLSINLATNPITTTLTNAEIVNSDITIYWNALPTATNNWYNKGNVVLVSDKYGVDTIYDDLNCSPAKKEGNIFRPSSIKDGYNYLTTTLTGSGLHNITFKDFAGNQHVFAQTSYTPQNNYSIVLIDKVIYNISYKEKALNPIEYGVFNDALDIIINPDYMSYYSQLTFLVTRNGNSYSNYTTNEAGTIYSFTEPGKYTVTISAFYGEQKTMLNNVVYNFTIIHSNSARLAYEFVEILGYEILEVKRNNQDITNIFDTDKDGRVFSVFISPTSGGNGYYTIKLKYGNRADQVLTYSFTINDYIPTISSNVKHGETTTGSIVISYNASTIYEQLGECYIKVLTYNNDSKTYYNYGTITIDAEKITSSGATSFEITRSNSYFIQVETKNGNIISSFRVNKTDPLNAMAIIIIVIAAIAVVVLIIVVVKLRTKMKIK